MKSVTMIGNYRSMMGMRQDTASRWPSSFGGIGLVGTAWAWKQGVAYYTVQSGDTLGKIATTYLGAFSEYTSIWQAQDDAYRALRGRPENIHVGDQLVMPFQAATKAQQMGLLGPTPPAAPDDKGIIYTLPEIVITAGVDEPYVPPVKVTSMPPAQGSSRLEAFLSTLKPWQRWALGSGAVIAATVGTVAVVRRASKKRTAAPAGAKAAQRRRR